MSDSKQGGEVLRQHNLRFMQLADGLLRLVLPRHPIPPSWSNLVQTLDHSEWGRTQETAL
jgi:hypothetical protein